MVINNISKNLKDFLANKRHPFHLVDPSPWPFFGGFSALTLTLGAVLYFHGYNDGEIILTFGLVNLIFIAAFWWRDVIREATFFGNHTKKVQLGLRLGMLLFIVSEVMFFFSFFWAFFHSSIAPSIEIGCSCLLLVLKHLILGEFHF